MKKYWFFFLFFNVLSGFAQSSICEGNLGDNIFDLGDFGSGTSNILTQPEGLTTTYFYVKQGPPSDGFFTITNNTGLWLGLYPTWLELEDNSADPNGYMVVVNADFSPGIFYEQKIEGLCSNTLYEFSADIINMIKRGVTGHILPNVSFFLDNEEKFTTGDIAQDEKWNTYGFTFITGPEVTSMTLSLRNNAPGGIGNDLALDNITFQPCGPNAFILPTDIVNICEEGDPIVLQATIEGNQFGGEAVQWQQSLDDGINWIDLQNENSNSFSHAEKSAGYYYYRYLLASSSENLINFKCRVNSNTKIVRVIPKFYTINDTLCEGNLYMLGDKPLDKGGLYMDSLTSTIGCDSIVTLNLTSLPDLGIEAVIEYSDPTCFQKEDGSISVFNIKNVYPPFLIRLGEREITSYVKFERLLAGNYEVLIEDRYGCYFSQSVQLTDPEQFVIDLGEDLSIGLGESVELKPITNYPIRDFDWSPMEGIGCAENCTERTFIPTSSQHYKLRAISEKECVAMDSIFVKVNAVKKVFIPNIFSPNGDGINDHFSIFAISPNVQEIQRLSIFDRWGSLVFEEKNFLPEEGINLWDGASNGTQLGQGVYLYIAKIVFLDGKAELLTGDVTIIR